MAVDTRLKRQSATCMLVPSMVSSVFPDTSGIVQAEWQAMAWMYSGISAGEAAAATPAKLSLNLDDGSLSIGLNF